jgi:hypothetical protein
MLLMHMVCILTHFWLAYLSFWAISRNIDTETPQTGKYHYCPTVITVDSNDITAQVSGEQKHYFHLWGFLKLQTLPRSPSSRTS